MLGVMFWWETLRPGTHVKITLTHTNYLNIAEDVHPFMAVVFTGGNGLFQQDITFCHKVFNNGFGNMTMLSWHPNFPDLNLFERVWVVLLKTSPRSFNIATQIT